MSRTFHHGERRIRVRGVRRDPPDLRRLARALIELAQMEAEAEAEAEHNSTRKNTKPKRAKQAKLKAKKTNGTASRGDAA